MLQYHENIPLKRAFSEREADEDEDAPGTRIVRCGSFDDVMNIVVNGAKGMRIRE